MSSFAESESKIRECIKAKREEQVKLLLQKDELDRKINDIDNEIQALKEDMLKFHLCKDIPERLLNKISNCQIDLSKPDNWSFSYDHTGHFSEKLYDYKRYPFFESVIDVDDNECSDDDVFDTELNSTLAGFGLEISQQTQIPPISEPLLPLIKTHVEISCVKQNTMKYFIKTNGERSRFAIFYMDNGLVIHNLDYKFDLSQSAQTELIKNYVCVEDIPEAVALALMCSIIEKGQSPIEHFNNI